MFAEKKVKNNDNTILGKIYHIPKIGNLWYLFAIPKTQAYEMVLGFLPRTKSIFANNRTQWTQFSFPAFELSAD